MINNYIEVINEYKYESTLDNYLYKKLERPIYKKYIINDNEFKINHKYIITLWNIKYIEKITEQNKDKIVRSTDVLLEYINNNTLKVPPSNKIVQLLRTIKNTQGDTLIILNQYYNIK